MTTAQLLVVEGRPAGKSLPLPCGDYYIGRGVECHIRPDSDWVSRQHCLLRVSPDGVFLRDLGSRNGTLVNGRLLSGECQLLHGDRIQIGPLTFELRLEAADSSQDPTLANQIETLGTSPPPPAAAPAPETVRPEEPSPHP